MVMNFKALKDPKALKQAMMEREAKKEAKETKKEPQEVASIPRERERKSEQIVVQNMSFEQKVATVTAETKKEPIMDSKWCYGCDRFSVDAPDTKMEMGYCKRYNRETDPYKVSFKKINRDYQVGDCPQVRKAL